MKKIILNTKKVVLTTLALLMLVTQLQMNPVETLNVYADEKGEYYGESINKESQDNSDPKTAQANLKEPELKKVKKDSFESLTNDGYREDISRRDEFTKVFVKGDEEKNLVFMVPIHEIKNGNWVDINLDFVQESKKSNVKKSKSNDREVEISSDKIHLKSDESDVLNFEEKQFENIVPTESGFRGRKSITLNEILPFDVPEGVLPILDESKSQILLNDSNDKEVGRLRISLKTEAYDNLSVAPTLELHKLEKGYGVSVQSYADLKPDTPFDIDVKSDVTTTFNSSTVSLFGVRSGANFKNRSYNPNGHTYADNAVIGNGDYNNGYIFCAGVGICESRNNWGIVSFYNGTSISDVIGSDRTVKSADLVLYYNTNARANDGKGAIYRTYMMDPSSNFDVENEKNITYNNLQSYLNDSATAIPMGNPQTATGLVGEINFDITDFLQSWENSGNHHGILIKGEANAAGNFLEAAHYFPNHAHGAWDSKRPYIEITTIKKEPVPKDFDINNTTLNLRPFTVNDRKNNVVHFSSLGFDGLARPGSTTSVEVSDPSNNKVYSDLTTALEGYRIFPQYTQNLGYDTQAKTQTYYRLTSNYQMRKLSYYRDLKLNTLYSTRYKNDNQGDSTGWKDSDQFLIYKVTAYDRLSRVLAFYGIEDKAQFMQDNNMDDELLVEGNIIFIRNPKKNKDKIYQPATLSENDKKMIDNNLLGRNQHCVYGYEPINFNTGNFVYSNPDMGSIDYDEKILFERFYNSLGGQRAGLFGRNWNLSLYKELFFNEDKSVELSDGTGRILSFIANGDDYQKPFDSNYKLEKYELRRFTKEVDNGYYDQDDAPRQDSVEVIVYGYKVTDDTTHETMLFDEVGNILSYKKNQYIPEIKYEYNDYELSAIITPANRKFSISLNDMGLIESITDPEGNSVNYAYDDSLNLIKFTDQMGYDISYKYDDMSRMLSYTGRENSDTVIKNTYDSKGKIIEQIDALGQKSQFSYFDDYTEIKNFKGNITRVYINGMGYTTKVEDENKEDCIKEYDAQGNLLSETKPDGTKTTYRYDSNNRLVEEINHQGLSKKTAYDTNNNVIEIVDFNGDTSTYDYDGENRLIGSYYANGQSEILRYNDENQKVYEKTLQGLEKNYTYDNGQLIEVKNSDGAITRYSYTPLGNLQSETDGEGNKTTYTYDARSKQVAINKPHHSESFTYDGDGHKVSQVDGNGNRTNYTYDAWSRLITTTTAQGSTHYEYDEDGNMTKVTDALGNFETFEFNTSNQLVKNTDKLGRISTYEYDERGNLTTTVNPLGQIKTIEFDNNNRPIKETFLDRVQTFEYDNFGNILKQVDPFGKETLNEYNQYNQLIKTTDSNGAITTYVYEGLELSSKTANGITTTYTRNSRGAVVEELTPLNRLTTKTYLKNGLVASASLSGLVTLNNSYDQEGRILSTVDADGNRKSYEYDGNGNVTATIDENGNRTTYEFNSDNRETKRISPEGYVYETSYDAIGNKISETQKDTLNDTVIEKHFEYNAKGRIVKETDAIGRITTYTYDDLDRLIETDTEGRKTTHTYDDYGQLLKTKNYLSETNYEYENGVLVKTSDNLGHVTLQRYNDKQQLIEQENEFGQVTRFEYDEYGHKIKEVNPNGLESHFEVNIFGEVVKETDMYGNEVNYTFNNVGKTESIKLGEYQSKTTFNSRGLVEELKDNLSASSKYEYDANGNVTKEIKGQRIQTKEYDSQNRVVKTIDAMGYETSYTYNILDQVVETTYPDKTTVQNEYDLAGRLVKKIDQAGFASTYTYDKYDQLIEETDALNNKTTYEYDKRGNVLTKIEPQGRKTKFVYDKQDRLIEQVTPNGNSIKNEYTAFNEVQTITYSNGLKQNYSYDDKFNLISEQYNDKDAHVKYDYDIFGRKIAQTDQYGNTVYFSYDNYGNLIKSEIEKLSTESKFDDLGRLIETVDLQGLVTVYTYDDLGQLTTKTDSLGYHESYEYDLNGNRIKTTNDLGTQSQSYDNMGRLESTTAINGGMTSYTYDVRGNQVSVTDALGYTTMQRYDELGRVVEKTEKNGATEVFEYDALGNVIAHKNAHDVVMKFTYDAEGNLLETKHKDERVEKRHYDSMNQLVRIDNVDNTRDTKEYDMYGNLLKETTNNRTTTYRFNELNQLESRTNEDGTINFEYDKWGQLVRNTDSIGNVSVSYDEFQHITSVVDVNGKEVKYTYDDKGRKASVVYPSGSYVYYTYDIFDRLVKVEDGSDTTIYEYDASNNPILEKNSKLETHREFDILDRLISQKVYQDGEVISELEYTRNAYGDILTSSERNKDKHQASTYEYDKLNQVIQEVNVTDKKRVQTDYEYDFRGNKQKEIKTTDQTSEETRYAYNKEFQLVSVTKPDSDIKLKYDTYGNVIEKSYSNGLVEAYEYDASNQLTDITDNYGKHITHEYDGLGNRTGRREETPYNYSVILPEDVSYDKDELNINEIIDSASDAVSNVIDNKYYCTVSTLEDTTRVVEETYVNDLAQDYAQVLETSRNDEDYESYTYGLTRLSTQSQQGTDYHIINGKFDIIGTVGAMKTSWLSFSLSGKSQAYDTPRFGYSSEAHEGTLQYLRARYYDTETGIFLSKDTYTGTKYNELSQNRYIYTENNPMNRTDPSGNFFKEIGDFFKKVGDGIAEGVGKVRKAWDNSSVGKVVNPFFIATEKTVKGAIGNMFSDSMSQPIYTNTATSNNMREVNKAIKNSWISAVTTPVVLRADRLKKKYEALWSGNSKKQLADQWADLYIILKEQNRSESEIESKKLEFIKKYCERNNLDYLDIIKSKSFAQEVEKSISEVRKIKEADEANFVADGLNAVNSATGRLISKLVENAAISFNFLARAMKQNPAVSAFIGAGSVYLAVLGAGGSAGGLVGALGGGANAIAVSSTSVLLTGAATVLLPISVIFLASVLYVSAVDVTKVSNSTDSSGNLTDESNSSDKGTGNKTPDDLVSDATETTDGSSSTTRNFEKTGDYNTAELEFNNLGPENVKEIQTQYGPGKQGTLSDGTSVSLRPGSRTGGSTIEIIFSKRNIWKIRFN
ncbi:MAG: RHS repeat-associated core domain-containing protein [Erysipelothrix sp.]